MPDFDAAEYDNPEIVVGVASVGALLIASVNGLEQPSGDAYIEDAN